MSFAPAYIIQRFFFRLTDFFHHWYFHGLRRIGNAFIGFLGQLDETFALKVTLRYFFQPLYKDYTIVGRILGIVFRSGRILIAMVLYFLLALIFLVVVAFWAILPVALLLYAIGDFLTLP